MSPDVMGDGPGLGAAPAPAPLRGVHITPCLSFLTCNREQGLKPSFVESVSSLERYPYARSRLRGKCCLEMERKTKSSCRFSTRFSAGLTAAQPVFSEQAILAGDSLIACCQTNNIS